MTYSYSVTNPTGYRDVSKVKNKSSLPAAAGGLVAGGAIGAFAGFKKNSITDKVGIKDSFAKKVEERLLNEAGESTKKIHNQEADIIKTINKVKSPEELRALFAANKDAAKEMCKNLNQTPDEFLQTITNDNLKQNKETIKNWFTSAHNSKFQILKNQIQSGWDRETKKFIQSKAIKDNVYNAIIKTQKSIKKVSIIKYGTIGAAIGAAVGFIISKFTQKI